jgi:hypothetical protein
MSADSALYDQDFERWASSQIELLRRGETKHLDIPHLIEELEDMGKSSLRELESRFIILIAHLLKWQYQLDTLIDRWRAFEGKSWRKTIIEQRTQVQFLLAKVPGLKNSLELARKEAYPAARRLALKETGMPAETFPELCPYSVEELLDDDFLPPA